MPTLRKPFAGNWNAATVDLENSTESIVMCRYPHPVVGVVVVVVVVDLVVDVDVVTSLWMNQTQ